MGRFDGQSSDEEDQAGPSHIPGIQVEKTRPAKAAAPKPERNHKRMPSGSRMLQSLQRLGSRSRSKSKKTESTDSPPPRSPSSSPPPEVQQSRMLTHKPIMSQMLEARAEASSRPSFDLQRLAEELESEDQHRLGDKQSSTLARRLMEIFQFETPEEVTAGNSNEPLIVYLLI